MVRALHNNFFDPETKITTPRAFEGGEVSVSCVCYLPIGALLRIFERDLNRPEKAQFLVGYASISAGVLRAIPIEKLKSYDPDKYIDVFYMPVPEGDPFENYAHCEIRGVTEGDSSLKITKGMAKQILKVCSTVTL